MYKILGSVLVVVHAILAFGLALTNAGVLAKLLGALIYGGTAAWILLNDEINIP